MLRPHTGRVFVVIIGEWGQGWFGTLTGLTYLFRAE